MHPAYQPLGAGSGVNGPRLLRLVLGRVPESLTGCQLDSPLAFIGLAADIKTPLQT